MSNSQLTSLEPTGHVGALDGLRAIAVTLFLLWHLTPAHNSDRGVRSLVFKIADIGWSGVGLFFVLSGFLGYRNTASIQGRRKNISLRYA